LNTELKKIAAYRGDFGSKFGVPRQSGLAETVGYVVFEKEYRFDAALRGLEDFDYIWLLWGFSLNGRESRSPTVRPPRLGGNTRVGVFATRSPYRPNSIGLSSVKLLSVEKTQNDGTVLAVGGGDLADGTPIYDVKPYLPFTDCHSGARGGFADENLNYRVKVDFPDAFLGIFPEEKRSALVSALSLDPRPAYQDDGRIYGFPFNGREIRFFVKNGVLTITEIL
jgi:tRNA-Thr(GGU) m(6)t(6)A37 methyltransferase TsaA